MHDPLTPVMGTETSEAGGAAVVVRRSPRWQVHEWEVCAGGGGVLCRAAAVRVAAALLLWVGAAPGELGGVALALPARGGALCTVLAPGAGGEGEAAAALARRLAQALARPVHVCCGTLFDRFTMPLVERALVAEIKSRPNCFAT